MIPCFQKKGLCMYPFDRIFIEYAYRKIFFHQDGEQKELYVHRELPDGNQYDMARNGLSPFWSWDDDAFPTRVAKFKLPFDLTTSDVEFNSNTDGQTLKRNALCEVPPYSPVCVDLPHSTAPPGRWYMQTILSISNVTFWKTWRE